MPRFLYRIKSDTGYLPFVRGIIPSAMERCDVIVGDQSWLSHKVLALVEAVNNAIIHAHKRDRSIPINIEVTVNKRQLAVEVHDSGKGFEMPPFDLPAIDQVGGRGLFLMRSLMDSVKYIKKRSGNILNMTSSIPKDKGRAKGGNMKRVKRDDLDNTIVLDVLYDLSQAITSARSLEDVCLRILDKSMSMMGVEKASIMKYDQQDGTLKIVASRGIPKEVAKEARVRVGEGISGRVFASSRPLLIKDIKADSLASGRSHYKSRSLISAPVMCFPMKVVDAPVGVINMTDKKDGSAFTDNDLKILRTIANQLAAYLHIFDLADQLKSTERLKRELEIARDIQTGLLPRGVPRVQGLDAAGRCLMADRVGGDYYDFLTNEWAPPSFVIADVSGHDVGAAMLMSAFRIALKSEASTPLLPPAVVVRRLNSMLFEDLVRAEQFISMAYVQYQPGTKTVKYTTAGHNPPLLFKAGKARFIELETDDPLLGIERGEHFHEYRVSVERGDVIVMYTDGVVEASNLKGKRFGISRLKKIVSSSAKGPAEKMVGAICSEVKRFAGDKGLLDDVTVVVAKVK